MEMKRAGARRVYEKLAGMSDAEQLAYWRERTEALRRLQRKLRAQRSRSSATDSPN
jgi:hypothetical protein